MSIDRKEGFQLGSWQVFPDQGLLEGPGGPVHIEPKVMEVLVYLSERPGEVVKRDELIADVWSGTVVTDEVLSRAISVLRTRLGDDRMTPSYIQTLPKVGYRLLMAVEEIPAPGARPVTGAGKTTRLGLGLIALAVLTTLVWNLSREDPVTDDPGSPAAFANLSEWFDFLARDKEGNGGLTSIAVLPFESVTEDKQDKFLSDGLTDELTMSLSKVTGLKVVARRSSYSFRNRNDDVPTIGRLLNVDAIFEGTIRQSGDQLRINALLSSVDDGYVIWSEVFECAANDLFSMQGTIAAAVITAMRDHFEDGSLRVPMDDQAPPDIEAYQLYLMNGNFLWKLRGEQPLRESISLYRQALAIDPEFSRAYIGLANSLVLLPFYSSEPIEPAFREVEEILASHRFTEKRDLGEVEAIRAFIAWNRWQWIEAEERFRRALVLAPDSPNIYQWYSQHLSYVGRKEDGLEAARRARELDEISPVINDRLGIAYLWLGDNIRAAEHFAIGAQLGFRNAINPGYMVLLLRLQRFNEFKSVMSAFHRGLPDSPDWLIENAEMVFSGEHRKESIRMAMQAAGEGRSITPRLQFGLWVVLQANDQAYETFHSFRDTSRQYLQLELVFANEGLAFRQDARFKRLAKEIGWTEYWKTYGGPDKD